MTQPFARDVLPDGSVRIAAGETNFVFTRPRAGVLLVRIAGSDKGPLDELDSVLRVAAPLELFIDASNAVGATVRVSEDWTRFLARHRAELTYVHVLAGSKAVELMVAIARHLSRTDKLIQLYSDPASFEAQLAAACSRK
jgi:hypothetical protein